MSIFKKIFKRKPKPSRLGASPLPQDEGPPRPKLPFEFDDSSDLWKNSKYKNSFQVFKIYFSTYYKLKNINSVEHYTLLESVDLMGKVVYNPEFEKKFDAIEEEYVTNVLKKAKNYINSFIITKEKIYIDEFLKYYNAFATILDPQNLISSSPQTVEELKIHYKKLETIFEEPSTELF